MEPILNITIRNKNHMTVTNDKKANIKIYAIIIAILLIAAICFSKDNLMIMLIMGAFLGILFLLFLLETLLQGNEYINVSGETIKLVSQYKLKTLTLQSTQITKCLLYDNRNSDSRREYGAVLYLYYGTGKYWKLGCGYTEAQEIFNFFKKYFKKRNIPTEEIKKLPGLFNIL